MPRRLTPEQYLVNLSLQPRLDLMTSVPRYSDFRPCCRVEPFVMLGAMLSELASCRSQLFKQLIIFHNIKELFVLMTMQR